MDLSTNYLGFKLPHPIIAGASPLVDHMDYVRRMEDAGAAAIVMHSLFEEQILHAETGQAYFIDAHEESFGEATSYFPASLDFTLQVDQYLERIGEIKETVSCPVIASLNGNTETAWKQYAKYIEDAGADALEMNLYKVPTNLEESSADIENRSIKIVEQVRHAVKIPVSVKLSPEYTALPHFVARLQRTGINGVVLFNRFYQPDIDIENLEIMPTLKLSDSSELGSRLRWASVLYGKTRLDLSVSGGVHTADDVIKAIMAGASSVQVVSAMLLRGPEVLAELRTQMENWLEEYEYESVYQMKGSMSYRNAPDPEAIERANYLKILQSWKP